MTVQHGIGLGVGNTDAIAVLQSSDAPLTDPSTLVEPATLRISATAAMLGAPRSEPGVIGRFVDAVGDPDGITAADGTVYLAEDLVATATASLLATAVQQFPGFAGNPALVSVHPARWDGSRVDALRSALDRAGLSSVRLVPDAVAAVGWYEATQGRLDGGTAAVCDIGAAGLTVSLVGAGDEPHLLVPPTFSPLFGGDSFDDTLSEYVLGVAAADLDGFDPADADIRADLGRLRDGCRAAKEDLSAADAATIPVSIGDSATEVTVTRSQFDEMMRGPLEGALALVVEVLRAHDVDAATLRAVVLTGGGAAIPLLLELAELAGSLPAPAVVAPKPAHTAVHGAAILAAGMVGGAGAAAGSPGAAATAAAGAAAAVGVAGDAVDDDAVTDFLPVVVPQEQPAAFTQAGFGNPVLTVAAGVAAAATPAAAAPAGDPADASPVRGRRTLVAAGVTLALLFATIAGVAMTRGESTDIPPQGVVAPATSTATATTTKHAPTTTTAATRTTEATTPRSTEAALPPPVTTAVPVPPPPVVTTAKPPAPTTTTKTTTKPPAETEEEEEEETTTTEPPTETETETETATETEPTPEPKPDPETDAGV